MKRIRLEKYPRTPHIPGSGAITPDDIVLDDSFRDGPLSAKTLLIDEKLDGANVRIRWDGDGDLTVGNREHVLLKGYVKRDTPAKLQFRPLWNWIYDYRGRFKALSKLLETRDFTIFAEWLYAEHSIQYDSLPEYLIPFAIKLDSESLMMDPIHSRLLLRCAGFKTPPDIAEFDLTMDGARSSAAEYLPTLFSPAKSKWSNGNREGIYLKWGNGIDTIHYAKFVHSDFVPVADFTTRELRKNFLVK